MWQQEWAEPQFKLPYCFDTSTSDNGLLLGVSKRSLKTPAPASPACHKPQSAKALPFETPCGFCLRKACGWSLHSQWITNKTAGAGSLWGLSAHTCHSRNDPQHMRERGVREQDAVAGNLWPGQNSRVVWGGKAYTTAILRKRSVQIAKSWE